MTRLMTRKRDLQRAKAATFCFKTRKLDGLPLPDNETVRAEKLRLIDDHIKTKGVTRKVAT